MEKKNTHSIHLLPEEITINIFTRLPCETVLHCKQVCKTWRNILRSCKHFPYMHLRRHQLDDSKVSYILTCKDPFAKALFRLYYGEYAVSYIRSSILELSTVVKIQRPPYPFWGFVLGSCNGLIMCQPNGRMREPKTLSVSNPMTREYLNIPIQESLRVCGFGYDTLTRAYKVVGFDPCSHHDRRKKEEYKVHVYTIESGIGWRRKENSTPELQWWSRADLIGISSTGALHWLDEKHRIWAFDFADEEFRCIPSPQFTDLANGDSFELRLLGECLSVVHYKSSTDKDQAPTAMDIWLLKRDNNKRKRDGSDDVNEKLEYYQLSTWNWNKEFSLTEDLLRCYGPVRNLVDPFAITKHGQLLLYYRTTGFVYRYRVASSGRPILEKERYFDDHGGALYLFTAIPYKKSFLSLKDLGGEDVKVFDLE